MSEQGMDAKLWYAVFTKPRQEVVAEANLERQRFEVYLPRLREQRRRGNRAVAVIGPLFPRYLFIRLSLELDNAAPVRSTKGVCGFVRFGDLPAVVPDHLVERLRRAADPQSGVHVLDKPLRRGERVTILEGPMAGLEAVFEARSGNERVIVLLDLLGQANRVSIPQRSIGRV